MKRGSYFINVGRGGLIDQSALLRHLKSGHLAGVGLDVVDPEPLPADDPMWECRNLLITPHVGAQSRCRVEMSVELFCENYARFNSGKRLINLVDKGLQYPLPADRLDIGVDGQHPLSLILS
jgi:D-3-phosphoglycerate dehydrogenase